MTLKQLLSKAEAPLFVLALVVLVMIFVLILKGDAVPQYLYVVLSALLAGGLGIAAPTTATVAPELPAEVTGLVGDLRKVFATLTEPAATTAAPKTPPAASATLTTVTTVPPPGGVVKRRVRQALTWFRKDTTQRAIQIAAIGFGAKCLTDLLKENEQRLRALEDGGLVPLDDVVTIRDHAKLEDRLERVEAVVPIAPAPSVIDVEAVEDEEGTVGAAVGPDCAQEGQGAL